MQVQIRLFFPAILDQKYWGKPEKGASAFTKCSVLKVLLDLLFMPGLRPGTPESIIKVRGLLSVLCPLSNSCQPPTTQFGNRRTLWDQWVWVAGTCKPPWLRAHVYLRKCHRLAWACIQKVPDFIPGISMEDLSEILESFLSVSVDNTEEDRPILWSYCKADSSLNASHFATVN